MPGRLAPGSDTAVEHAGVRGRQCPALGFVVLVSAFEMQSELPGHQKGESMHSWMAWWRRTSLAMTACMGPARERGGLRTCARLARSATSPENLAWCWGSWC